MPDKWTSKPISCQGGLVLDIDTLIQGTQFPGTARILQNMEPDVAGGYRRINGYTAYDDDVVPGTADTPVLGVKVGYSGVNGVFACRRKAGPDDNAIYFSFGTGWTGPLNTTARPGDVAKARFITYSITQPVIVQCDGVNPAWKWNGTVDVTINGSGAPTNPKFAALFKSRLVLGGYGTGALISLSAANDDEDFSGGSGAVEINVGDTVKGLHTFRDELVIFCESSIKKLSQDSSGNFLLEYVTTTIGCVSGDTIQEIGGDLIYVSTDGLRSYAATARIGDVELSLVSKSIQPLVRNILSNSFSEGAYSTCCVRKKSQYRLFINNSDVTEDDNLGILGRLQDSPVTPHGQFEWATIVGIRPYCADSAYSGNAELSVIGHPTDGFVYRLESGNTFAGRNIAAIYRTPDITFDDATLRKVFHKADIITQLEGTLNVVTVQLLLDREMVNVIQPATIPFPTSSSVATYGAGIYGTSQYGVYIQPLFRRNLIGSGMWGAFQFVCNDDSAPFRIDSFIIQFSVKGRR